MDKSSVGKGVKLNKIIIKNDIMIYFIYYIIEESKMMNIFRLN